jgi:predicted dehydrogenase
LTVAGVIGYGSAGRRHAGLLAARGCDVIVADPDDDRLGAAATDGFPAMTESELRVRADAVIVASPNHLHASQLAAAVVAGKDVLVEKPIGVAPDDELVSALAQAKDAGLVVGVGCNLRFVPAIERLRTYVREDRLGRVLRATADFGHDLRLWRPGRDHRSTYSARPEEGGGILLDAIHEFDYLYWTFGDVGRVACIAGSRSTLGLEVEDVASSILDFESGVIGTVTLDYASGVYRRGFEVVGEEGTLTWRWGSNALVHHTAAGSTEVPVDGPERMYERLIDDFLSAVADRRAPRTPGDEGLAVLRIVDAARTSAFDHDGGAVQP